MNNVLNEASTSHRSWNNLSMQEKAAMIRVAVKNGLTDLKTIREKYNEFAEGGDIYPSEEMNEFGGGGYIYDVLPGMLKKAGLDIRVSSGYRPAGKVGTSGKRSWHWRHGAVDIVPQGRTTFEDIERVVSTNPEIIQYMTANGFGYLDETNRTPEGRALMKKTGATGNHFHFGKDTRARERYQAILGRGNAATLPVTATSEVIAPTAEQPIVPFFMPSNPQVFFSNPVTTSQPVVDMGPTKTPMLEYDPKEAERQEKRDNLNRFNMFLGMLNGSNESTFPFSMFAEGGKIHISPSKKGTFTAAASRHNMGVQEFASKVLANKDDYSPAMVKKANFARNASRWKHGLGGNLFEDGGDKDNIFKYINSNGNVRYVYQNNPDAEEVPVRPLNTIFPDPAQWTFTDDAGRFYTPRRTTPTNTAELNPDNRTGFERVFDNYIGEAFNTVPKGYHTLPAIGAAAFGLANPAIGKAALTSAFGAHGISRWVNGEIHGPLDAAMTALEIAPLGMLAKPMYEGIVQPGMRLFNSPLTGNWTKIGNKEYRLSPNSLGVNGSPLESRSITTEVNISPEELYKALQEQEGYYFMGHGTGRTNVDPEVIFNNGLRIKNGEIGNTTSPLSESNLVTWPHANSKEVIILPARAENTMFDSAHGRIPSDWYDANTFQWIDDPGFEGSGLFAVQKPNASFAETVVNGVPGVYTKPSAILGSYNTDTHVLRLNPNSQYKFPFSANTAPEITAENAANEMPNIVRTVQDNGKIRLSLPSHTDDKPRQFVLEPAPTGDNKYYVHMRMWDDIENKVPASNVTNEEKQQLFDALYDELPEGAEILFPKSGPGNYGTRGTVVGLQRLSRDPRFTPGTKGTLQYLDKDGKTVRTYEGTSFIKMPQITAENAARITPDQWTAAQDAAIARGDIAEAQRLRDLHFKVSAPNSAAVDENRFPLSLFHGTRTAKGIREKGFSKSMSGKGNRGANEGNIYLSNNYENAKYTGVKAHEIDPIIDKVSSVYDLFDSKTIPSIKQIYSQADDLSKQSAEIVQQSHKLRTGTVWDRILTSLGLKNSPSNRAKKLQNIIDSNDKKITELNRRAHIASYLDDGLSFIGGNRDRTVVNTLNFIKEPVNPTSPYRQIAADRAINAMYGTTDQVYSPEVLRLYGNFESPLLSDFKMSPTDINPLKAGKWSPIRIDYNNREKALLQELAKPQYDSSISKNKFDVLFGDVYITKKPNSLKLADAVTYDNNGIRIPLGSRDNFNMNDIRYGLLPFGIGLTGYGLLPGK